MPIWIRYLLFPSLSFVPFSFVPFSSIFSFLLLLIPFIGALVVPHGAIQQCRYFDHQHAGKYQNNNNLTFYYWSLTCSLLIICAFDDMKVLTQRFSEDYDTSSNFLFQNRIFAQNYGGLIFPKVFSSLFLLLLLELLILLIIRGSCFWGYWFRRAGQQIRFCRYTFSSFIPLSFIISSFLSSSFSFSFFIIIIKLKRREYKDSSGEGSLKGSPANRPPCLHHHGGLISLFFWRIEKDERWF